jgi:hypothetical protein
MHHFLRATLVAQLALPASSLFLPLTVPLSASERTTSASPEHNTAVAGRRSTTTPVHESASMLLFGSGILIAARTLRRQ